MANHRTHFAYSIEAELAEVVCILSMNRIGLGSNTNIELQDRLHVDYEASQVRDLQAM